MSNASESAKSAAARIIGELRIGCDVDIEAIIQSAIDSELALDNATDADQVLAMAGPHWVDEEIKRKFRELEEENAQLRLRLLSAAGDDLCRLTQEEIKAYTSGEVQIPPKEVFIASCERFHEQIAAGPGVLKGCLTLAQLVAENERLRSEAEENERETMKELKRIEDYQDAVATLCLRTGGDGEYGCGDELDDDVPMKCLSIEDRFGELQMERDTAIAAKGEAERLRDKYRAMLGIANETSRRRGEERDELKAKLAAVEGAYPVIQSLISRIQILSANESPKASLATYPKSGVEYRSVEAADFPEVVQAEKLLAALTPPKEPSV